MSKGTTDKLIWVDYKVIKKIRLLAEELGVTDAEVLRRAIEVMIKALQVNKRFQAEGAPNDS